MNDVAAPVSEQPVARGSRRRRIWELASHAQCPIVGSGLPTAALRKLLGKVFGGSVLQSDYELHCGTVADCKQRTPVAEAVQAALDQRFATHLRHVRVCKTSQSLALWWQQHGHGAALPGVLWAVLTHPRCSPELESRVLGEVHMLQHQVGHQDRADHTRQADLHTDLARAQAAAESARRRQTTQAQEHSAERERLMAELVRLRGQVMARDVLLQQAQEHLAGLRHATPDLPARLLLKQRLYEQTDRAQALQRALNQALSLQLTAPPAAPAPQLAQTPACWPAAAAATAAAADTTDGALAVVHALADKTVLCVGGRTATVPVYRRLIEATGARFLHHDGGEENKVQRLEATLGAAELVICQVGCISHDAYWRVKEHCKRHGKRCVFVDNPSASSLQRALGEVVTERHTDD